MYLRPLTNKNKQLELESLFQEATLEQPSWRTLRAYQGLEILDTSTPALQVLLGRGGGCTVALVLIPDVNKMMTDCEILVGGN